jgi:hypothetical protein
VNILAQMVAEKRTTVTIGIGRWHLKAIGQEDYKKAAEGTFLLLSPYITPENAPAFMLPEGDQRRDAATLDLIPKMTPKERTEFAQLERATASAGVEGVSDASEQCATANALHAEPGNAGNVEGMAAAEAAWNAATTKEARARAAEQYAASSDASRVYVGSRHRCNPECFPSYRPIKFVPREQDENPEANLIHINTIPATTISALFGEIMALCDEGGRARKRIAAFQPGAAAAVGQARPPVRAASKRVHKGRQPRGPVP